MTIAAGCDVGSLTSKAVLMKGRTVLGSAIIRSGPRPADSAARVMGSVLEQTGLSQKDIDVLRGNRIRPGENPLCGPGGLRNLMPRQGRQMAGAVCPNRFRHRRPGL
jgi:hypothetical protein